MLHSYAIKGEIGRGSNGVVYRAAKGERVVALKVVEGVAAQRVLAAAPLLESIDHPGLVRTLEHGQDGDRAWVASELCPGGDLSARLAHRLEPGVAAALVARILDALAVLHARGLVHGDLKPANVLFRDDGWAPVLCDVGGPLEPSGPGLAPSWREGENPAGTAAYASPERLSGASASAEDDVFAAGVLFFEALVGARPCGPERPTDVDPAVPRAANEIHALLCGRAAKRPAAAKAATLVHDLEAAWAKERPVSRGVLEPGLRLVAPVGPGASVRVVIDGEERLLSVGGCAREQAALLGPDGAGLRVLSPAPPRAWEKFLALLPEVEAVAVERTGDDQWLSLAAQGPVIVRLARDVHRFDRLRCRDAGAIVHERHALGGIAAAKLRDAFRQGASAERVRGLVGADEPRELLVAAYSLAREPLREAELPGPPAWRAGIVLREGEVDAASLARSR